MLDSIYHMTLRLLLNLISAVKRYNVATKILLLLNTNMSWSMANFME